MSNLLEECIPFVFENKPYLVAPRDIFVEKQFSLWVSAEAALSLDRLRALIPTQFYREQLDIYNSKVAGKLFEWGRIDCHNASTSDEGEKHLLFLKLKRGESKGGYIVEREDIDKIKKDKEKWNELLDILYRQDYPEQYADFLQLNGRTPQRKTETNSENQGNHQDIGLKKDGINQSTGSTNPQTQSSAEKVLA